MKKGFTLAEVLITLAVIGVVAAMTIPNLIQSYNEKVTVTKVKKMYSTLSNAYKLVKIDNGDYSQWGIGTSSKEAALNLRGKFEKYLKFSKLCDDPEDLKECGAADVIYQNDNKKADVISPSSKKRQMVSMMLADGSSLYYSNDGRGIIYYDVNGLKEPNTFGRDIFPFEIWEGAPSLTSACAYGNNGYNDEDTILSSCITIKTDGNGYCCTTMVVKEGNMEYLK